ncbi:MAG: hypothetical protein J6D18_03000, partial [Erysipelotrichaceae bacterium]|nr:hypothetical protein [Erysipelotrichaceae bacterium]
LEMGYSHVLVSEECSDRQILQMGNNFYRQTSQAAPLIKRIYGRRRMMIMKHCPINTNLSDGQRKHCSLCHRDRYELVCDSFRLYCRGNQECMMELYEEKPVDRIAKIPMYQEQGIKAFFIDFLDETEQEKEKIRMRCKEAMAPFDFD